MAFRILHQRTCTNLCSKTWGLSDQLWGTDDLGLNFFVEEEYSAQWSRVIPLAQLSPRANASRTEADRAFSTSLRLGQLWKPTAISSSDQSGDADIAKCPDFDSLPMSFIAPVSGGGIRLKWGNPSRSLDLKISDNGSVQLYKSNGNTVIDERELESLVIHEWRALITWLLSASLEEAA